MLTLAATRLYSDELLGRKPMNEAEPASYNSLTMKTPSRPMRMIATLLAFALVHGAFAPQAWAQVVSIGAMNAPVSGSAAAAATNVPGTASSFNPAMTLSNSGLTSSLSAPAIAPAPLLSAVPSALAAQASAVPSANATRSAAVPTALTPTAVSVAASKKEAPNTGVVPAAAKAAATETGPITLQAGLRTGRVANKAASIISGVRAFFGGKSVETVPAASEAIVSGKLSAAHASELEPSTNIGAPTLALPVRRRRERAPAPQKPQEPGRRPRPRRT